MLKRFQVLLPDWLEEYIHWKVKRYDLSFSELIRLEMCMCILARIKHLYPDYHFHITVEEALSSLYDYPEGKLSKDQIHQSISKIYFEARKAVEFRLDREKSVIQKLDASQ